MNDKSSSANISRIGSGIGKKRPQVSKKERYAPTVPVPNGFRGLEHGRQVENDIAIYTVHLVQVLKMTAVVVARGKDNDVVISVKIW